MKILLVSPPSGELTIGLKYLSKVEPLGLEILGAAVPGHQVEVLDMELDTNLIGTLERFQPDVVGVSAQVVQTYAARRVLKTAKAFNPKTLTLLGGHHATLCPEEFNASYIDAVVLGEGVTAFQEVIERQRQGRDFEDVAGLAIPRNGHMHYTPTRPIPATLDHHPLPDRSLTARYRSRYYYLHESPVAAIQTSLGCPYSCNFCSCQKFTRRRFIPRALELVVEDLSRIEEEFVIFCDDHSFTDVQRMERLHELIAARGIKKRYFAYTRADTVVRHPETFERWARIGLQVVMTGLEAIDDASIDIVDKGTNASINEQAVDILEKCGIGLSAGFLVMPDFTEADFKRIDDYIRARPSIVLTELTPLTPLPGTDLHAEIKDTILTHHREVYDLAHFVVPTELPLPEMYRLIRKYYFRAIWRAVMRMRLYRPKILFQRHIPRLLAGIMRTARIMGRSGAIRNVPVPREV
ncbi:MAG: B12-binding domain-containing radical SAM protein [Rhodothermales bacterium]